MGAYKEKAEQLEKVCKEQNEKIMELKAKLEDRNSKIAKLESELLDKEKTKNINNMETGGIISNREHKKLMEEILSINTDDIQDDIYRFGIECCQKCIGGKDKKKEFDEIFDMFNDYMEEYSKIGVIRFLTELTQKLRDNGVAYTVESFDGKINVKGIFSENSELLKETTVDGYKCKAICNGDRMYIDRDCVYEIVDKGKNIIKKECEKLSNQHQSDCIKINQLQTALDVVVERYQSLREIHGL